MAYSLLISMQMEEHLLQYLLIDLFQPQILLRLGIMEINVSVMKNVFGNKRKSTRKYKILLQLMLQLVQMEEYRLSITVLEIVTLHLVVIYPIRQRTHNFHDQIVCLKSKLIFNTLLFSC